MSAGDDNIFARWSRRKQAVRYGETPAPDEEQNAPEVTAAEVSAEPVDQQPAVVEADAGEPLPSLEDLTAESDLSAFLRKGVPEALKSAALRKIWSLDPTIRDYIGPSEYAWDFNQPGSMAGFGPLDANESIAEFLSTMSGGARAGLARTVAPPEAPLPPLQQTTDVSQGQGASIPPDSPAERASPPELLDPQHVAASTEPISPTQTTDATEPANAEEPPQLVTPRRHGGATPR
jgi:hypothetical protein